MIENPKQFLLRRIGKKVQIKLKWNQIYKGILKSVDDYFNILIEDAKEIDFTNHKNNHIDNEKSKDLIVDAFVGNILIRCNNIKMIYEDFDE